MKTLFRRIFSTSGDYEGFEVLCVSVDVFFRTNGYRNKRKLSYFWLLPFKMFSATKRRGRKIESTGKLNICRNMRIFNGECETKLCVLLLQQTLKRFQMRQYGAWVWLQLSTSNAPWSLKITVKSLNKQTGNATHGTRDKYFPSSLLWYCT